MAPKGKRIKTTTNTSKARIAPISTRMKTRVPRELAPRYTTRHACKRTTPSPEPIPVPSPTPSPPPPPLSPPGLQHGYKNWLKGN